LFTGYTRYKTQVILQYLVSLGNILPLEMNYLLQIIFSLSGQYLVRKDELVAVDKFILMRIKKKLGVQIVEIIVIDTYACSHYTTALVKISNEKQ
jgi:hypothetical protein